MTVCGISGTPRVHGNSAILLEHSLLPFKNHGWELKIYTWMLSCGMICVPGELNGVTAVADKPGEILDQANRLRQAEILGENVLGLTRYSRNDGTIIGRK